MMTQENTCQYNYDTHIEAVREQEIYNGMFFMALNFTEYNLLFSGAKKWSEVNVIKVKN